MNNSSKGPPALLTMPDYTGTLAALRGLGERGVRVTVSGSRLLATSRWSRYAASFVRCPDQRNEAAYLEWLLEFGERNPGYFLYPTSDDIVWLLARNEVELRRRFLMYQPGQQAMLQFIDKHRLYQACARAQLDTPSSWFPIGEEAALRLGPELPYPVILKPRSQAMLYSWSKGSLVRSADELLPAWRERVARDRYSPEMESVFGIVPDPIIQRYCDGAANSIYSIAGFIDESGELLGVRAAVKVLQRPRRVGFGVCFESAPVLEPVTQAILRLCREVGYFGIFEAEFVVEDGRYMLIDFNPRFYGQMEMEHQRGLPLAWLSFLGATGDRDGQRAIARESAQRGDGDEYAFCHRFFLEFSLAARRAAGLSNAAEHRRWREWCASHRGHIADATASKRDPLPAVAQALSQVLEVARHPRRLMRLVGDA